MMVGSFAHSLGIWVDIRMLLGIPSLYLVLVLVFM